ncbi:MAG: hypothetical protein R3A47_04740 [Polyangiales bacterium]
MRTELAAHQKFWQRVLCNIRKKAALKQQTTAIASRIPSAIFHPLVGLRLGRAESV